MIVQLAAIVLSLATSTTSQPPTPLAPPDTSSPRATLTSFLREIHRTVEEFESIRQDFLDSGRLYASEDELARIEQARVTFHRASRCFDLSETPTVHRQDLAMETAILLREVLDRIELPPLEQIPGPTTAERESGGAIAALPTRFVIPNTEIAIARVVKGERINEYLFTPSVVSNLRSYYDRVKHLPHQRSLSIDWFDRYAGGVASPRGFIPPRWFLRIPPLLTGRVLDQPLWRWIMLLVLFAAAAGVLGVVRKISARLDEGAAGNLLRTAATQLVTPVAVLFVARGSLYLAQFSIGVRATVLRLLTSALETVVMLAAAWIVWLVGGLLAEILISSRRLRPRGIDSQLLRLGLRLTALCGSVAILLYGTDRLGLPAFSIFAGLGVGGLAVALAARDSLANLMGSLVIMLEKPFRVGHWIRVGDTEGTVEGVGFRSTRIRTFHDSLISIPSSDLVNQTVDNMGMRSARRVRIIIQLMYNTPGERLDAFLAAAEEAIRAHPMVRDEPVHVVLHNFGDHAIEVLVYFFLDVPDWNQELRERQTILRSILAVAEKERVRFALPTQFVPVEQTD